jgi:hypothetical protein
LLIVLLVGMAGGVARGADDTTDEARSYFDAGRQAAQKGQFLVAITAFEEAYKLSPRGSVVYALAYSYRQQYAIDRDPAKLARAVALFHEYLDKGETDKRDRAASYLAELEPELQRVEAEQAQQGKTVTPVVVAPKTGLIVSTNVEGATASIDGGAMQETPFVAEVKEGKHRVRAEAPGFQPVEIDARAKNGQVLPAAIRLVEVPASVDVRAPKGAQIVVDGRVMGIAPRAPVPLVSGRHFVAVTARGHVPYSLSFDVGRGEARKVNAKLKMTSQRKAAYWIAGGGLTALAAGFVTTGVAVFAQSDAQQIQSLVDHKMSITPKQLASFNGDLTRRDRYAVASVMLYCTAAVAISGALLMFFFDNPQTTGPAEDQPRLVPTIGPGELGVAYSRSF